jgi:hypothetical protein
MPRPYGECFVHFMKFLVVSHKGKEPWSALWALCEENAKIIFKTCILLLTKKEKSIIVIIVPPGEAAL